MKKKQDMFDGRYNDPNIEYLKNTNFTYPNYDKDKETILQLIREGDNIQELFDGMFDDMKMRQAIHDGDDSNEILMSL